MAYYLDLFSGIGGFALGAYWAGLRFDNHYFSEVDPYAVKIYQQRFPDAIPLGDITKITKQTLADSRCSNGKTRYGDGMGTSEESTEKITCGSGDWILAGGFPCQDISVAGKGAGITGLRSGLWFHYARLIDEIRPRYAIMENVGALTRRGLDAVLGSLAEIGYDAQWSDIRASDLGAPHRRERIWILAYPRCESRESGNATGMERDAGIGPSCELHAEPGRQGFEESSNPDSAGLPTFGLKGRLRETQGQTRPSSERGSSVGRERNWSGWLSEPDLGGTLDGLSSWLDGFDTTISHQLLLSYGQTTSKGTGEILRMVRDQVRTEVLWRQARGPIRLSPETLLLSYVCKLQERYSDEDGLQREGSEAFEDLMRILRSQDESDSSSYRSRHDQQRSSEYPNFVQILSRLLALHGEKAWMEYRRKNADLELGWETGFSRTAQSVPERVNRLKGLGNSIVPQIAEVIFRQEPFDEWRLA